jgi:geranylgeranyl reductase family protein
VLDLLIIGAGPAGSAAAIEAERAGLHALTIDKATFPRDKCCGDGLTTGALRHLDALGLDPTTVPSWQPVSDVHVAGPNGKMRVFPLPRDNGLFAVITRRSELDAALVARAREVGADIREGTELIDLSIDADATGDFATATVRMSDTGHAPTEAQTVHARHVIAADGMWSASRKMLDVRLPDYRGDWHAFRQYFTNVSSAASSQLFVWFEPDLLPGYVWSFPLADGSANVGFGIQRGTGHKIQDMKTLWPDLLARPHIAAVLGPDATPEGPHKAWPIPARLGQVPLTSGPVLWVGDAAAATDPMTGEGIGQAIETGRLAVACVVRARRADADDEGNLSPAIAADYERRLRKGMVKDHGLARTLSGVLATKWGSQWSVNVAGSTAWTRRNFARWLFEDYPRAIVGTPSRWHRKIFTGDGAYTSVE